MTEYFDKLINAQELFLAKEQEIFLYINNHEIPDELRSILMEWVHLKSQYSEIGTQYLNAQKQENEAQEMVDSYNARDRTSSYYIETMTTEDGLNSKLITW
jgi:hypothetical protein